MARTEDAKTGRLKLALFIVPTDAPNFEFNQIEMDLVNPEKQFLLFLDDVRLPADALVGSEDAALSQLFAGLNPERIMAAASAVGMGRYALGRAVEYVNGGLSGRRRSARTRPSRTRWPSARSRWSWRS